MKRTLHGVYPTLVSGNKVPRQHILAFAGHSVTFKWTYAPAISIFSELLAGYVAVRVGQLENVNAVNPQLIQHVVNCCFQISPANIRQARKSLIVKRLCFAKNIRHCCAVYDTAVPSYENHLLIVQLLCHAKNTRQCCTPKH